MSLSMYIVNEIGGFNISKWWKNRQIHQNQAPPKLPAIGNSVS